MNHIRQRNQLEERLKSYKDFMPDCPFDSMPKLVKEMIRIHDRIETIREFTIDKLVKQIEFQYETKQSKLNFKTK